MYMSHVLLTTYEKGFVLLSKYDSKPVLRMNNLGCSRGHFSRKSTYILWNFVRKFGADAPILYIFHNIKPILNDTPRYRPEAKYEEEMPIPEIWPGEK